MTHRFPWTRMGALALTAMLVAATTSAAPPKPAAGAAAAAAGAAAPDKPFAEWKKTVKDAEEKKGFFTMWKKRDNLYLQINKDQLEKPFLYIVSYSRGIGSNYLLGGLPLDDRMLQFERHGDRVLLVDVNMRFTAPAGTPIDRARDLSIGNSVVQESIDLGVAAREGANLVGWRQRHERRKRRERCRHQVNDSPNIVSARSAMAWARAVGSCALESTRSSVACSSTESAHSIDVARSCVTRSASTMVMYSATLWPACAAARPRCSFSSIGSRNS